MIVVRLCWVLCHLSVFLGATLAVWLWTRVRYVGRPALRREAFQQSLGRGMRLHLEALGAAFIKLGQILSARRDLLPEPVIGELAKLQDQVKPFPAETAQRILLEDLGEQGQDLLQSLSPQPLAAASMAQVHTATVDGKKVAVKVQRPDIERTVRTDLRLLLMFSRWTGYVPFLRQLDLHGLCRQFSHAIAGQLDFPREVENNERFRKNFTDLEHVRVPELFPALCGKRVITMAWIDGKKVADIAKDPPIPRAALGRRFLDLYYHMAFGDLFLHADLHPGNILVDPTGTIFLLDTGLVYEIPEHYVRKFLRVAIALPTRDGRLIGEAYLDGLDLDDEARTRALDDLDALGKRYVHLSFSELEIGTLIFDIMRTLRRNGIRLDAEWAGLMLSDITFEGLAKSLDGDINIMEIAAPFVLKHALKHNVVRPGDPVLLAATRVAENVDQSRTGAEL